MTNFSLQTIKYQNIELISELFGFERNWLITVLQRLPVGLIYMSIDLFFFLRDLRAVNKPMFVFLIRFCLRPKRNNLERPQRLEDRVSETALCKRNSREYDHNCRTVQPVKQKYSKRVFVPSTIVVFKLNPRNHL